jgi:hypothetical protein
MQKIKLGIMALVLSLVTALSLSAAPVFAVLPAPDPTTTTTTPAAAAPSTSKADACSALQQLDSTRTCNGGDTGVNKLITAAVTILSYIVGIAAVIMVIISGLKYVTASGDPSNVSSAKNTLLYALIGLFITALAQFLVHFVLSTANK